MLESSPAAAAAIESGHRVFRRRLLVDWDGTPTHPLFDLGAYVIEVDRDHALTATVPDEVQLVEGYAAGKLTVRLAGEFDGHSLADQFAPYNRASVFYESGLSLGVPVAYSVGVVLDDGSVEWWPQFAGVVRTVDTDRETGDVTLECLDNAENLRTSIDIPPYALWQSYLQNGFKRGGLVDSSSVIDLAARSGGFTMGPRTRWAWWKDQPRTSNIGPVLSVPFHGSVLPEIGMLDNDEAYHLTEEWEKSTDAAVRGRAEAYRDGPHGYLAHQAVPKGLNSWNYKKYWFDEWDKQAGSLVGTWVAGGWVYWTGSNIDESSIVLDVQVRTNHLEVFVRGNDGGVEARLRETNGYLAWTNTPLRLGSVGWHYIEANWIIENAANYAMRVRIDDTYSAETRLSGRDARDVNDPLSGLVRVENRYAISDVYVVKSTPLTTFSNFTYETQPADTAVVSWGRNRVAYTLRESQREAWGLAKEVAGAEYGTCYFDERGRFVFANYADVIDRQAQSVRTFTLDDLSALAFRDTFDAVANAWTVTTRTGRAFVDIAYDMARDGVPFVERPGPTGTQLMPADFRLPASSANVFWLQVNDRTIALNPWNLKFNSEARGEFGAWDQAIPTHALKSYTGLPNGTTDYREQAPNSEQKMTSRTKARLYLTNGFNEPVGFVLITDGSRPQDGQARFRIEGTLVHEDEPYTWVIRDQTSIDTYGERVLELASNFWLQDEWQTRAMLADVVERMGRPIPVSEQITVPGDPRLQIGDTVTLTDAAGFGERMKVQILGLKRRDSVDEGLRDTYTVEAIEPPGPGQWDHPVIGQWDTSMIWG